MAAHVVVTSSTARSTKVKVNPGTYMSDVLDRACKSLNLDAGNYLLKHKQRNVDLSVPFRIAGLVGGAKLDLVVKSKSPAPVSVAVVIPPPDGQAFSNGRIGGTFPSNFTIWQVLRQLENLEEAINAKLNITARGVAATSSGKEAGSGQLYYETPVLNIMGRELCSFPDYQRTLSQLGYNSGSVLIRLSYMRSDVTFFEAQQQMSQYFQELEEAKPDNPASSTGLPSQTPAPSQVEPSNDSPAAPLDVQMQEATDFQTNDSPMPPVPAEAQEPTVGQSDGAPGQAPPASLEPTSAAEEPAAVPRDPLAPVGIFSAPSSSTPAAALTTVSEADFVPSIAHAQLHQAQLLNKSRNKRLPSDKELAERAAATKERLSSVQSIEVKVRFPDNTSANWVITQEDTGAKLYKAVRSVMADPSLPFRLVVPGSKDTIRDVDDAANNRVMRAYKLTGRVLVNLVWDDTVPHPARSKPFLKSSAAQAATNLVIPEIPTAEEEEGRPGQGQQQQQGSRQGGDQARTSDDTMKKLSKFFNLPGKKK